MLAAVTILSGSVGPPPGVAAAGYVVAIGAHLDPTSLTVRPGDTVTWRNADGERHRMRSMSGPQEFDSGNLEPGESFSFTFSTVGTYRYRDERDPERSTYWGTIIVSTTTPPPGSGPTPVPPGATPAPAGVTVTMAGRVFRPATVTIVAGGRVTWLNDDDRDHTVTANDSSFDSGLMGTGGRFARTFPAPGSFAYLCLFHPDMTGTVTVSPAPGATPPPATPLPPPPPATPLPPPAGPSDVAALDFAFSPATIDIVVGTRVSWTNHGAALHTVTARDGAFDSGLMARGATFGRRFAVPGSFPYLCALHPEMTGIVRVAARPGQTAPPAAPALEPAVAPTSRPSAPPGTITSRMLDFSFDPLVLEVPLGTTVRWRNDGVAIHTVTATDGSFDSGIVSAGGSYERTFDAAGTVDYMCTLHPQMIGTIVVLTPGDPGTGGSPGPSQGTAPPAGPGGGDGTGGDGSGGDGTSIRGGAGSSGDESAIRGQTPATPGRGFDPGRLAIVIAVVLAALAAGGAVIRDTMRPGGAEAR